MDDDPALFGVLIPDNVALHEAALDLRPQEPCESEQYPAPPYGNKPESFNLSLHLSGMINLLELVP